MMGRRVVLPALLSLAVLAPTFAARAPAVLDLRRYGAKNDGSADVASALISAIADARSPVGRGNGVVYVPRGEYLLNGSGGTVNLSHITIACDGQPPDANATVGTGPGNIGHQGATFWLTSATVQPFTIGMGVRIIGCNFYWPNQTGTTRIPKIYPPLFTEVSGMQAGNIDFINDRVINAYDFFDAANPSDSMGNIHLRGTYGYAIHYWFNIANIQETSTIIGMSADVNLFQEAANVGHRYLAKWTAANGEFIHVFGNGSSGRLSTDKVTSLIVADSGVFGYHAFVHVTGTGFLAASLFNTDIIDGTPYIYKIDDGGCAGDIVFDGDLFFSYQYGAAGSDHAPAFSVITSVPACSATLDIRAHLDRSNGDAVDLSGSGVGTVKVDLGQATYARTSTPGTYYFAKINGSNARVTISGTTIYCGKRSPSCRGVYVPRAQSAVIRGNTFDQVYDPIDTTGDIGPVEVTGNHSLATSSRFAVVGRHVHQMEAANNWDVLPSPRVSSCGMSPTVSGTDIVGTVSVGSGTVDSCTIVFANRWISDPKCFISSSAGPVYLRDVSTSHIRLVSASTSIGGGRIDYECRP